MRRLQGLWLRLLFWGSLHMVCWTPAGVMLTSGLLRDCLAGNSPASGVSSLLGLLSGWVGCRLPVLGRRSVLVVVQVAGVTEASMAAQWHEVLHWQVTCQEVGVPLDGGAVEVGEGSDLT